MNWFVLLSAGLWRRPGRTLLTTLSLASAFLLVGLLFPILLLFENRGDSTGITRLIVQPRHSITDFLPINHAVTIQGVPGVRSVSHQTWFGGTFRDGTDSFARWAVPADSYFPMHPEMILSSAALDAFARLRTAAIVGQKTADRFGLKVGDRLTIVPDIWPNKEATAWEFELVGIFDASDNNVDLTAMYLNHAYFDEYRAWGAGLVSYINVGLESGGSAGDISTTIDARFANSADETTTSSERDFALGFAEQLGDIGLMISVILGAVLFTIALVTANTVAHGMRERMAEFAVLRAMGFQKLTTQLLVTGEALALVLLGALPGLLISAVLVELGQEYVPQLAGIDIGPQTLTASVVLVLVVALLAVLQPALRLKRLHIVDELRKL